MMVERAIGEMGQLVPMPVDDLLELGRVIDKAMGELAHLMVNRIWTRLGEDGFVQVFRSVHADLPQFGAICLESLPANSGPATALRAIQCEPVPDVLGIPERAECLGKPAIPERERR